MFHSGGEASVLLLLSAVNAAAALAPCDIYAQGNTPCVAAHSTTRALYSSYSGALYQLRRGSDGATLNISPRSAGGAANGAAQDSFCTRTTYLITTIYDQSGHGNHLTQAPPGDFQGPESGGFDSLAAANGAPVTLLGGNKAYGIFIAPGSGYRNNAASDTATGDSPEGMYAVMDGTHVNGACCFDYGNAEPSGKDEGAGHMEAIYFGTDTASGTGAGSGPWIMADLENGLFSAQNITRNNDDPSLSSRFVTAVVKGKPGGWAIRGASSSSSALSTFYDGGRPAGYDPMQKGGAIILGTGGDNSNSAQGTFYEGAMTSGYPSNTTEDAVQANIAAAGYAVGPLNSGPTLSVGSVIAFRATTACCTTRYIAHTGATVNTQVVSSRSSSTALKRAASWTVRTGLGNSACFSFEARDAPGSFLRHSGFQLFLNRNDGSKLFAEDATYCTQPGFNGQGTALRSWSFPAHFFRHYNAIVYAASNGGPTNFDTTNSFTDDASFVIGSGFA